MRCKYLFLVLLILSSIVSAHNEIIQEQNNLISYITISSLIITISVFYSLKKKKLNKYERAILFTTISLSVLFFTTYLVYETIYLNINSITKGPVHWHADFEIWACKEKLDLKNPEGFFNRIGTSLLHEHNDFRIHIEGVVKYLEEINLHNFFEVIGGILEKDFISIPTNSGFVSINNNDLCNKERDSIQVFVYKILNPENTKKWVYKQEKIKNFEKYTLSPYSSVPPGDCIIIDFDKEKEKTNHICESYKVAIKKGELNGS